MSFGNITSTASQSLSDVQSLVNGSANAVLQPFGMKGVAGWVFDIPTGENLTLESDITDHYTEDNMFVNDHIVNKPIRITLRGLVGELVYKKPQGLLGVLDQVATRLGDVAAYAGAYTPGFVQKAQGIVTQGQAVANKINRYLDTAQNALRVISSAFGPQKTKQQNAYDQLFALWQQKTIFSVTTPWSFHKTMAIESLGFVQNADTSEYTELSISLKEFRFAETKLTTFTGGSTDINGIQTSAPTNQGNAGLGNKTALDLATGSKGLAGIPVVGGLFGGGQ